MGGITISSSLGHLRFESPQYSVASRAIRPFYRAHVVETLAKEQCWIWLHVRGKVEVARQRAGCGIAGRVDF